MKVDSFTNGKKETNIEHNQLGKCAKLLRVELENNLNNLIRSFRSAGESSRKI